MDRSEAAAASRLLADEDAYDNRLNKAWGINCRSLYRKREQ